MGQIVPRLVGRPTLHVESNPDLRNHEILARPGISKFNLFGPFTNGLNCL